VEGGYQLARAAGQITVADVIRAVDGPLANIAGSRPEDVEYSGAAVALRDTWVALRAVMRSVLEQVTLADLADERLPSPLLQLLDGVDVWHAQA
jgi:Rrf2 family protein